MSLRISTIIGVLLTSMITAHPLLGQKLIIHLRNAKTGLGMRGKGVTVDWDNSLQSSKAFTDKDGDVAFEIPAGATDLVVRPGPKSGSSPYRIAYENCNGNPIQPVSISEIRTSGHVYTNSCGKAAASKRPEEMVVWGLALPWWKPSFQ